MRKHAVILGSLLAVAGALGLAADAQAGVNARQHRQQARIVHGVRSGELTRREAARLEARERHIRREERRYRADGVLGPRERADLNRDLNRTSRSIRRQKHDGQTR
jgi:hypothetical protein